VAVARIAGAARTARAVRIARIARVRRDWAAAAGDVVAAVGVIARVATPGSEAVAVIDSRRRVVPAIAGRIIRIAAVTAVEARVVTVKRE
jgi:hypothetical protein